MILTDIVSLPFFKARRIWYAPKPSLRGCLSSYYKQCSFSGFIPGYFRTAFYTSVVDLSRTEEEIFQAFDKDTRRLIKKAQSNGFSITEEINLDKFRVLYNRFALSKKISPLSPMIFKNARNIVIRKVLHNGCDLVAHCYLIDNEERKVRLLHSVTGADNSSEFPGPSLLGQANRLLHFDDIKYFKNNGHLEYDLGGIAVKTSDKKLLAINKFKECFGGRMVMDTDYLPLTDLLSRALLKVIRR